MSQALGKSLMPQQQHPCWNPWTLFWNCRFIDVATAWKIQLHVGVPEKRFGGVPIMFKQTHVFIAQPDPTESVDSEPCDVRFAGGVEGPVKLL